MPVACVTKIKTSFRINAMAVVVVEINLVLYYVVFRILVTGRKLGPPVVNKL